MLPLVDALLIALRTVLPLWTVLADVLPDIDPAVVAT